MMRLRWTAPASGGTYFQITLPLILPISLVALLFGLIFTFTDMVIIYNLTRGGPYDTTQVLASLAFYTGIAGETWLRVLPSPCFSFPALGRRVGLSAYRAPNRGNLK